MIQQADRNGLRLSIVCNGSYAAYKIIFHIEHVVNNEPTETGANHRTERHQVRILLLARQFSGNNVTGNQEYIKIGNEATSKIATIVHQKR